MMNFPKICVHLILLSFLTAPIALPQGNTIEANGGKLHYEIFGKGEPILIINGGPGMNSIGFAPLAMELGKKYQAIIYDQRGTGKSTLEEINGSTVSIDLMVKDIEALRMHLKIDKWTLLGHSFGGILGYFYASQYPERVKAMIQSSSGGMDLALLTSINIQNKLTEIEWDSLQYYRYKINEGDTSYATLLKRGEFMAPAYLYNREYIPLLAKRMTQGNMQINALVWSDLRRINYDAKGSMQSFEQAVLILHGKNDLLETSVAETAHRVLPNSQLELMDRCAHYGWLDRPDVYFKLIHDFMDSL
jgi:proline iminopeptidase